MHFIIALCGVGYIAAVIGLGIVALVCAVTAVVLLKEQGLCLDFFGNTAGFALCVALLYGNAELFRITVNALILN